MARDPRDPSDPKWSTSGAPDAVSAGHAARVQELRLMSTYFEDQVDYLMDRYGDTREQAEAIVKNCRGGEE